MSFRRCCRVAKRAYHVCAPRTCMTALEVQTETNEAMEQQSATWLAQLDQHDLQILRSTKHILRAKSPAVGSGRALASVTISRRF